MIAVGWMVSIQAMALPPVGAQQRHIQRWRPVSQTYGHNHEDDCLGLGQFVPYDFRWSHQVGVGGGLRGAGNDQAMLDYSVCFPIDNGVLDAHEALERANVMNVTLHIEECLSGGS